MCGGCAGGGRAGPSWEDVAGRVDAAGMRRRLRAVQALRVRSGPAIRLWHGAWMVSTSTGRQQHVRTLDELFALLPPVPHLAAAGRRPHGAAQRTPTDWDLQAALVWTAALAATGWCGQLRLPGGRSTAVGITLEAARPPFAIPCGSGRTDDLVRVQGPGAEVLLGSLVAVGGPASLATVGSPGSYASARS